MACITNIGQEMNHRLRCCTPTVPEDDISCLKKNLRDFNQEVFVAGQNVYKVDRFKQLQ